MHGSVSVCVINNVSVYMYFVSVCKLGYMHVYVVALVYMTVRERMSRQV